MRLRTWTATCALALCTILHGACRGDTPPAGPPAGPRPASAAPAPALPAVPRPASRTAQTGTELPASLAAIVAGHRQIIVLVEQGPTLAPEQQARADLAGRLLFQDTHHLAGALSEALVADLATPDRARVLAFLDALESHRDLRDADKLAFRDVVGDLDDAARGPTVPPALRTRIADDARALDEIEALYTRELERVFGRFRERGMPVRREAWEAYVAHLGTRYTAAAIVEAQAPRLDVILKTGRKAQAETPLEVSGQRLPLNHVALTFDDGPHPKYTDAIRTMLAARGIPAVFFHVGQNVGTVGATGAITPTRASAASRKLAGAGFTLANHTFSHQPMPGLSDRDIGEQIASTNRVVRSVLGASPTLFRPPYGARDTRVLAAVQAQRMTSVLWNIDSKDWADPLPLSIADRVIKTFDSERRGIVLFHDIQRRTVQALPRILDELQARGVRFVGWDGTGFSVPASAAAQTPAPRAVDGGPLYRESWAVVVGIDQYRHWPALAYAVNDAKAIREVLIRRYRFAPDHVTMLLDGEATRERILAAIGDRLTDPGRVTKDDRVFVFFAGHGTTRRLPSGKALGYLVPVDADLEHYQSQSISMTNFQDASDAIPARHLFLVTDACYSGLALTRGGPQQYLREVTGRVARQVLTAGGADETVADNGPNGHSIFTWTLLQGLEGRADLSGDGFITASELAAYVGPLVSQVSRQTPAFGSLPGSEGGEFVFELQPETEFLSTLSTQLDDEAIRLNGELERLRASVADKQARNERLRQEVARARSTPAGAPASAAVREANQTAAGLNDRGMALYREKRYAEALDAFLAATTADPRSALAANNAGFAYFRLGRHADAVTWFERTIALDPQRAIAFVNLGDARLAQRQPAEARAAYERYLVLQPNSRLAASIRQKLATL